jgi:hypothetical protein
MTTFKIIFLVSFVVTLNGILGHYFAPNGILFTPIVVIMISLLVGVLSKNINSLCKSILTYAFIGLNDVIIKLFSGGVHDHEGFGFIHFFLFVGLIPSFGILIFGIWNKTTENKSTKIIAILTFPLLIGLHLFLFQRLGLGRNYSFN